MGLYQLHYVRRKSAHLGGSDPAVRAARGVDLRGRAIVPEEVDASVGRGRSGHHQGI